MWVGRVKTVGSNQSYESYLDLGGGNSNIVLIFTPENGGNNDPISLDHIFQMGWFNHQPVSTSNMCKVDLFDSDQNSSNILLNWISNWPSFFSWVPGYPLIKQAAGVIWTKDFTTKLLIQPEVESGWFC